jgi:hypothetical protein
LLLFIFSFVFVTFNLIIFMLMLRFLFSALVACSFVGQLSAQTPPNGDFSRIYWNNGTLNGSGLELGTRLGAGIATSGSIALVDFHFDNGLYEDFNVRLINSRSNLLQLMGGSFYIGDEYSWAPNIGSHKLAVNGSILSTSVVVKLVSAWPDFVFSNSYNLRSLSELEKFIKNKGHLPDVPSAEEVEESGINLGEMDAKLLRKIEELTLYVIEQNKKIENLENKVNILSK